MHSVEFTKYLKMLLKYNVYEVHKKIGDINMFMIKEKFRI